MTSAKFDFIQHFKLRGPLVLAPLAGGPGTPELVAAVCNRGALGSFGAAYSNPVAIGEFVAQVRELTAKPFAINLFIPTPDPVIDPSLAMNALRATAKYRTELEIPVPLVTPPFAQNFDRQFEAVLAAKPAALSFVFGLLPANYLKECRTRGIVTIGTATTEQEALELEASGVDAVVVQGVEAGGHRGIFSSTQEDPQISTRDLVKKCAKLKIPILAAGGLMNGADISRVLEAGAVAAQLGTAFLLCEEAGTSAPYRERLQSSMGKKTALTRAFSGRLARGLENRFLREMAEQQNAILPFPAQNKFTRDIREASVQKGSAEFLSLWAGMGVDKIRELSAGELVEQLFLEIKSSVTH